MGRNGLCHCGSFNSETASVLELQLYVFDSTFMLIKRKLVSKMKNKTVPFVFRLWALKIFDYKFFG